MYNNPKMIETISNARNIGDVSTEIKEALAVKAKVKLYTKILPSFLKDAQPKRKEVRKFFNLKDFQHHESKQTNNKKTLTRNHSILHSNLSGSTKCTVTNQ